MVVNKAQSSLRSLSVRFRFWSTQITSHSRRLTFLPPNHPGLEAQTHSTVNCQISKPTIQTSQFLGQKPTLTASPYPLGRLSLILGASMSHPTYILTFLDSKPLANGSSKSTATLPVGFVNLLRLSRSWTKSQRPASSNNWWIDGQTPSLSHCRPVTCSKPQPTLLAPK